MIGTSRLLLIVGLAAGVCATDAWAQSPGNPRGGAFAVQHPRRNEVNTRVGDQRARINQGVRSGELTRQQAHQLRTDDRAIKQQEHAEVRANGGYLTKGQQHQLNREENANSAAIYGDKHP